MWYLVSSYWHDLRSEFGHKKRLRHLKKQKKNQQTNIWLKCIWLLFLHPHCFLFAFEPKNQMWSALNDTQKAKKCIFKSTWNDFRHLLFWRRFMRTGWSVHVSCQVTGIQPFKCHCCCWNTVGLIILLRICKIGWNALRFPQKLLSCASKLCFSVTNTDVRPEPLWVHATVWTANENRETFFCWLLQNVTRPDDPVVTWLQQFWLDLIWEITNVQWSWCVHFHTYFGSTGYQTGNIVIITS